MKYNPILPLLILFPALLVSLGCQPELTEEQKIKSMVETIRNAANEKNIYTIMERLADDYQDQMGRGKEDIRSLIATLFYRYRNLSVMIRESNVMIEGDTANVQLSVSFQNRSKEATDQMGISQQVAVYELNMGLVKRSEQWLVMEGGWRKWGSAAE